MISMPQTKEQKKKILEELKEFNVKTLRTDKDFAITISSDGTNYIYKNFKNQKGH